MTTTPLKIDLSLAEVREWREGFRKKYEGYSSEEFVRKHHENAQKIIKKRNLKLNYAPLPDPPVSEKRKLG